MNQAISKYSCADLELYVKVGPPSLEKYSGSAPDIGPNVTSLEVVRRTKMLDSTMFKSECLVVL